MVGALGIEVTSEGIRIVSFTFISFADKDALFLYELFKEVIDGKRVREYAKKLKVEIPFQA